MVIHVHPTLIHIYNNTYIIIIYLPMCRERKEKDWNKNTTKMLIVVIVFFLPYLLYLPILCNECVCFYY